MTRPAERVHDRNRTRFRYRSVSIYRRATIYVPVCSRKSSYQSPPIRNLAGASSETKPTGLRFGFHHVCVLFVHLSSFYIPKLRTQSARFGVRTSAFKAAYLIFDFSKAMFARAPPLARWEWVCSVAKWKMRNLRCARRVAGQFVVEARRCLVSRSARINLRFQLL